MTGKIKKIRDEMAKEWHAYMFDHDTNGREAESFVKGFDAAWAIHERLLEPMIKTLEANGCHEAVQNYLAEVYK